MFRIDNNLFLNQETVPSSNLFVLLSSFQGSSDDREERKRPARRAQFGKGCFYFIASSLYGNAVLLLALNSCSQNEQNYLRFLPTLSLWSASTPNSRAVPSGSSRGPSVWNHRLQEGAAAGLWTEQSDHAGSQSKEHLMMRMLNEQHMSSFLIAKRPAPDFIISP